MNYTIDAKNKKLGRVASEAASVLIGKNNPSFKRESTTNSKVEIINASGIKLEEKKKKQKEYKRFTGYPGGLKSESMEELIKRRGIGEVVRKTVYGMLPKNKLRSVMKKNLTVKE